MVLVIREVEFLAPNTTRLHLLDDAWQTWIYDVSISGMMLERGHAPMFAMKADTYLTNPVANNGYLLTEDVNFGEVNQVKHIDALALNAGNMYACIATSANPRGTWGSKANNSWQVPTNAYYLQGGVPSVYVFAVAASNLTTLLTNIASATPQFMQTVQGVFFASDDLITLGTSFTFNSVTCYSISATRKTLDLTTFSKTQFGYGTNYANLAKLYTSPYAHLEITDENGNLDVVKIEDTTGDINVSCLLSIAYPFINLEAHLSGVGGSASTSITFKNVTSRTFPVSGQWYETLRSWQIPTFAVVLAPNLEYDYSTHFDRAQRVVDYTTEKANADASADTMKANADANATNTVNNAALVTACNTANSTAHQTLNTTQKTINNGLIDGNSDESNAQLLGSVNNQIDATLQSSTVSAVTQGISAAGSALTSGNPVGAAGAIISGGAGIVNTMAQAGIATNLAYAEAENTADFTYGTASHAKSANTSQATASNANIASVTANNNTCTTGTAANDAATIGANATRDQTTQKANATRTQNQAISAIDNDIKQAALNAPSMFGTFANGDSAATKPIALFAHVVTQSKGAIESAGDEFLRYGYMLDRYWTFNGNWNIGKYFTYWKLRDFWVTDLNVPDMYMDKLRFFLFGGVTVWKNPSDIGKKTIYENFN